MTTAKLTPAQRNAAYLVLFVANAVLVAFTEKGLIPATYAQLASLVSLGLAAAMKQLGSTSSPTDPPPPAVPPPATPSTTPVTTELP